MAPVQSNLSNSTFITQRVALYRNQLSAPIVNQPLFTAPTILPTQKPAIVAYELTAYVMQTKAGDSAAGTTIGPLSFTYDDGTGVKTGTMGVKPLNPLNGDGSTTPITGNTPGSFNSMFSAQVGFVLASAKSVTFSCPFVSKGSVPGEYAIVVALNQL